MEPDRNKSEPCTGAFGAIIPLLVRVWLHVNGEHKARRQPLWSLVLDLIFDSGVFDSIATVLLPHLSFLSIIFV